MGRLQLRRLLVTVALLAAAASVGRARAEEELTCSGGPPEDIPVNIERLSSQFHELARKHNDAEYPAVTRVLFTDADIGGRNYVKSLMREAGLQVREDLMGNIYGRLVGTDPEAAVVQTGSHCDAIPLSGIYDGVLGVLGGIEALRALKDAGFRPKRSIDVIMFTSEEPTRFGLSCSGSRAMAGVLDVAKLARLTDTAEPNGTFAKAAAYAGYGGGKNLQEIVAGVRVPKGAVHAFVELHIEQGPELEDEGLSIGIVTAIAAPAAMKYDFFGDGGHAGGQLMFRRNDAGLAGAELALAAEQAALSGTRDSVATTGVFRVSPGAVNSVPRHAHLEIDVRDIDGPRRDAAVATIDAKAKEIAERRKVRLERALINQDPPATCADIVVDAAEASARHFGLSHKRMVSRAYHDSLFMALFAPTGMIFIPCRGGVSHRPDEFAADKDIEAGTKVLAATLARLSLS